MNIKLYLVAIDVDPHAKQAYILTRSLQMCKVVESKSVRSPARILIPRFLRRNDDVAEIHVLVAAGSEITYKLKFGDEQQTLNGPYTFKENATRKLSTDPDFNVILHYYR